ncbi:MAG: DUF1492 domain-containing protein [Oscillospiraceae bacterium]|nr:DUF1492 domain-containing protein [Oscillospiraceae bacterium]
MTTKEYLRQAYLLDQRINLDIKEKEDLRKMAYSLSAPSLEERVQKSAPNEATYTRTIEKLIDMEHKIDAEIDLLVDLRKQIHGVIDQLEDPNSKMVLRCRYIHNMSFAQIGDQLYVDKRTVMRWHDAALAQVKVPENPIVI